MKDSPYLWTSHPGLWISPSPHGWSHYWSYCSIVNVQQHSSIKTPLLQGRRTRPLCWEVQMIMAKYEHRIILQMRIMSLVAIMRMMLLTVIQVKQVSLLKVRRTIPGLLLGADVHIVWAPWIELERRAQRLSLELKTLLRSKIRHSELPLKLWLRSRNSRSCIIRRKSGSTIRIRSPLEKKGHLTIKEKQ